MKEKIKQMYEGFVHLFFPNLCEGCSRSLVADESVLCLHCKQLLPRTAYHHIPENESAMRLAGRVPYSYGTSFAYFTEKGLLQHLLHGLKYKGKKKTGVFLGTEFARELRTTSWINEIDLIIPIPLHAKKERERGFNQSFVVAAAMGKLLQIPVAENGLLRVRHTESQTQKTRLERLENVSGAFKPNIAIEGKHVLLIDDVLTSGATLEAASLAVLEAGAVGTSFVTIAIAS
ncbi:ComF family protein [Taibaiella soli]|uniref:ComF family protein n=1 Tax=Taibaiella soli TaxID=1649169 RepID=A0A2W2AW05_9BACT|nr:phosphoribosyltransferase family protein [Taibaiella soli]PZF72154.1 ComF family protein [Taibaiella soli]